MASPSESFFVVMHGRKRSDYKERRLIPEVAEKASKLRALEHELLRRHHHHQEEEDQPRAARESSSSSSDDAAAMADQPNAPSQQHQRLDLDLSSKYLQVNPDPLWLWSDRRRILLVAANKDCGTTTANRFLSASDTAAELSLTNACLRANPKSYGAWLHRKWLCLKHASGPQTFWNDELDLVGLFLSLDERNFHCWNYRYFLVGLQLGLDVSPESVECEDAALPLLSGPQVSCAAWSLKVSLERGNVDRESILQREWDFTTEKIRSNFSNFSAFHYRSKLLPLMSSVSVEEEWDLVENAIFTDPYDQTVWWYHHFLLGQCSKGQPRLQQHFDQLLALKDDEPDCKWVYLGLIHTVGKLPAMQQDGAMVSMLQAWWSHLCQLDPDRKARYETLLVKNSEKPTNLV